MCVSERERCEEPTQRLWGLMPAKVAGQPSSLEAQAGCPEREALLFCKNSFSTTVFNCSDATHPHMDDHLLNSESTDDES